MDYKKYSLENLENWMHDAISCSEASPQEIYDVIKNVVRENYYFYKDHTRRCGELLALLNGNDENHVQEDNVTQSDDAGNRIYFCAGDDPAPYCKGSWNDFWEENYYPEEYQGSSVSSVNLQTEVEEIRKAGGYEWTPEIKKDKVNKWVLPVNVDGLTGDCFVNFPDDLLEAANLKEGDQVEWADQGDGSYLLKKVEDKTSNYQEAIDAGYTITDDGIWVPPQDC